MRLRRGKFSNQLFFVTFFSILLILMLFCGYIIRVAYKNSYESLLKERINHVSLAAKNLDQKIKNIENAFSAYSNTEDFEKTFSQPFSSEDFQKYQSILSELAYISLMGAENTNYSIISLKQNWMIKDDSLFQVDHNLTQTYIDKFIKDKKKLYWEEDQTYLRMFFSLPVAFGERYALAIAEIPKSTLSKLLSVEDSQYINIYDKDNNLLYGDKSITLTEKLSLETSDRIGKLENRKGNIDVYTISDYNQWIYTSSFSSKDILLQMKPTLLSVIIIISLGTITIFFLSYRIAIHFSKPISIIKNKINEYSIVSPKNENNDLNAILFGLEGIIGEKNELQQIVHDNNRELEKMFVFNLLRNEMSTDVIKQKLHSFNYPSENMNYRMCVIEFSNNLIIPDRNLSLLAILNIISDSLPSNTFLEPVVLSERTIAIILQKKNSFPVDDAQRCMEKIQTNIMRYLKMKIDLGMSREYHSLVLTSQAHNEAIYALRYRIKAENQSMILYDGIQMLTNQNIVLDYPHELEIQLISSLRLADRSESIHYLHTLLHAISQIANNIEDFEIALFHLVDSIYFESRKDGINLVHGSKKIISTVLGSSDLSRIEEELQKELIEPYLSKREENLVDNQEDVVNQLLNTIHAHFDQELSLDYLADQLHYHPDYLSRLFKKETGKNFMEYLSEYRLLQAKKMLDETNFKIQEISEKLNYKNPQSFIRFFKKLSGITPGEYRKMRRL